MSSSATSPTSTTCSKPTPNSNCNSCSPGGSIEGAHNFTLTITVNNCRVEGETPKMTGPEYVYQTIPFVGLDDASLLVRGDHLQDDRHGALMPVVVTGLDQLAQGVAWVDPRLTKALQKGHKEISTELAQKSQAAVSGLTDAGGRGASGIRPRAGQKKATIALLGSNAVCPGGGVRDRVALGVRPALSPHRRWHGVLGNRGSATTGHRRKACTGSPR